MKVKITKLNTKEEIYSAREKVNDRLKSLRKQMGLPRHRTDLERVKLALKGYKNDKVHYKKIVDYIETLMFDKFLAGLGKKFYIDKQEART